MIIILSNAFHSSFCWKLAAGISYCCVKDLIDGPHLIFDITGDSVYIPGILCIFFYISFICVEYKSCFLCIEYIIPYHINKQYGTTYMVIKNKNQIILFIIYS